MIEETQNQENLLFFKPAIKIHVATTKKKSIIRLFGLGVSCRGNGKSPIYVSIKLILHDELIMVMFLHVKMYIQLFVNLIIST